MTPQKGDIMTEPQEGSEQPIMTVDQVAAYLQVSSRTIYNLAAAGEMPAAKVGEQWRFYRPEIDRWLIRLSRANVGEPEGTGIDGEV